VIWAKSSFYHARPQTAPGRERHQARFLTPSAIERLREEAGPGGLDFAASILPLMRLEMISAYYATCAAQETAKPTCDVGVALAAAEAAGRVEAELEALTVRWGPFNPDRHLTLKAPASASQKLYRAWLVEQLREDMRESQRGIEASPLKAALEVWRDLRDGLRAVVDGDALSAGSRRIFFRNYAPLVNRLVAGPQKERIAELLCLIEAGLADVVVTANPAEADRIHSQAGEPLVPSGSRGCQGQAADVLSDRLDYVVHAYLPESGTARRDTPLLRNLARRGLIRDLRSVADLDGVAVTPAGRVIDANGVVDERIWLFGPAAEGATYYNHYIPSPGHLSRAQRDAQAAVEACFVRHTDRYRASCAESFAALSISV